MRRAGLSRGSGVRGSRAGFRHGGAGFRHGGAGFRHGGTGYPYGAGFRHGGAGFRHGGAGFRHGGAGFRHGGAGFRHCGTGSPYGAGFRHGGTGSPYGAAAPWIDPRHGGTAVFPYGPRAGEGERAAWVPGARDTNLVIWDVEMCPFPDFCEPRDIIVMIKNWLFERGFCGRVEMIAICDPIEFPPEDIHHLRASGVSIKEVNDGRYPCYADVLMWSMIWTFENPLPANVLFISAQRTFATLFSAMEKRKYNVLRMDPAYMGSRDPISNYKWSWEDLSNRVPLETLQGKTSRKRMECVDLCRSYN